MSSCAQNLTWLLAASVCLALSSAVSLAQEPSTPVDAAKEAKNANTASKPAVAESTEDPKISEDGTVAEFSPWTRGTVTAGFKSGNGEYRFPAITNSCATKEVALLELDTALEEAMTSFLFIQWGDSSESRRLTPPASTIRNLYLVKDVLEIEKRTKDGSPSYRAALQIRISQQELTQLTERDRIRRQGNAVFRTLFVGGGLLAFVAILAIQARLNHASGGKRSGILRAATMIAILSLLSGFMTAAVLGRVFTS